MIAAVITNGELGDVDKLMGILPEFDLVVCCDGGIRHLDSLGLAPDLIIGDFDSVHPDVLDEYRRKGVPIQSHPAIKNETDTELAVRFAAAQGAAQIIILGALGSRWDHSFANVMLLVLLAKMGIDAMILHSHNRIVVSRSELCLTARPGQLVSLLPLGENVKIRSTKGLKYPIINRSLPLDTPYGISNIFTDACAEVKIDSGWLMAVLSED
ncbi:MAG: thiamine diphosphokinase [Caldicoprobacterales bacterium]|jgi:thiamine pyrophosphokinase|nr:thiamine diphosphokinase [Clostridiales bacterium]